MVWQAASEVIVESPVFRFWLNCTFDPTCVPVLRGADPVWKHAAAGAGVGAGVQHPVMLSTA